MAAYRELSTLTQMLARRATWRQLNEHVLPRIAQQFAVRFGGRFTQRKLGQPVRVIGIGVGAVMNFRLIDNVAEAAYWTYRERLLLDKGADEDREWSRVLPLEPTDGGGEGEADVEINLVEIIEDAMRDTGAIAAGSADGRDHQDEGAIVAVPTVPTTLPPLPRGTSDRGPGGAEGVGARCLASWSANPLESTSYDSRPERAGPSTADPRRSAESHRLRARVRIESLWGGRRGERRAQRCGDRGRKSYDALRAVPNLMERYRQAKYVVDHREQVQAALDYAHEHAPDPQQLETAVQQSSQTLDRITTTYSEVTQARETFASIRPNNILERLPRAKEHFDRAWAAKPDLESDRGPRGRGAGGRDLPGAAGRPNPDVRELYANLLSVMDNFASDEIAATLAVMAAAFALAYTLGMAAGYWGRRGRPGFIAGTLQRWGTRHFRDWYVANLEYAMSWPLYERRARAHPERHRGGPAEGARPGSPSEARAVLRAPAQRET